MTICIIEDLEVINIYHNQSQRIPSRKLIFHDLLYSMSKALLLQLRLGVYH